MDAREDGLLGTWLRSPEDDAAADDGSVAGQVYRPFDHPFPRARAPRPRLVFETGGVLAVNGPAPADAPSSLAGTWQMDGDTLVLDSVPLSGRFRFTVDTDTLVLRPE